MRAMRLRGISPIVVSIPKNSSARRRYSAGPIEIDVAWNGSEPTLFVRDRGPGFSPSERVEATPDLFAESGRGLFMIRAFAHDPLVLARPGGGTEVAVRLRRTAELPSETLRMNA